ncbi:MAG: fibronectin type III domain-containing protein [Candidatus Schekmanbacteria bacterium]|nr:fibronectin type III domain-containing protein [Candidatus Schekmanbacteria bacterium]
MARGDTDFTGRVHEVAFVLGPFSGDAYVGATQIGVRWATTVLAGAAVTAQAVAPVAGRAAVVTVENAAALDNSAFVTGLTPATRYERTVRATDGAGNTVQAPAIVVTTPAQGASAAVAVVKEPYPVPLAVAAMAVLTGLWLAWQRRRRA